MQATEFTGEEGPAFIGIISGGPRDKGMIYNRFEGGTQSTSQYRRQIQFSPLGLWQKLADSAVILAKFPLETHALVGIRQES